MNRVLLGKYVKIKTGKLDANASSENGSYPFFTCAREISRINEYAFDCEAVLVAGNGELNVKYYEGKFNAYQRTYVVESLDKDVLSVKYIFYYLDNYIEKLRNGAIGGVIKYIKLNHLTDIKIPLPDIEKQKEIVVILDKAKAILEKREETIHKYDELLRATFLDMFGDPCNPKREDLTPISNVIYKIHSGWSPVCEEKPRTTTEQSAILKQGAVSKRFFDSTQNKLLPDNLQIKKAIYAQKGDLLFSRKNTPELVGATAYVFYDYENLLLPDTIFNLRYDKKCTSGVYLYYLFNDSEFKKKIQNLSVGQAKSMSNISQERLLKLDIPVPDFSKQKIFEELVFKSYYSFYSKILESKRFLEKLLKNLSLQAFSDQIIIDINAELEALIDAIELDKKDEDNKIDTVKNDVTYVQRLIDRLSEKEFESKEQYDKAKYILFRLMFEEEDLIKQVFRNDKIQLTLINEIT